MSQPVVLLDVPEVLRRIGLSRSALYRLIDKGRFPKAVYPSPKAPRWRSDAIEKWIDDLGRGERAA